MTRQLEGKVAAITGAGSGIGRATALRFAAEGARVVVNDIDADGAASVVAAIAAAGGVASAVVADVSESVHVGALIDEVVRRHGRLDVLHNNAFATEVGPLASLSDGGWRRSLAVTLDAVFYGIRAALPVMLAQGSGSIINTASISGLGADYGLAAYNAAKAAVINLTRTAAIEHAHRGVRVNAICPGVIATPPLLRLLDAGGTRAALEARVPARRLGTPEEIANVALFLASDEASYVTGAAIVVDGGLTAQTGIPSLVPGVPK
jgi:meso-butanediol dehydrogenase/(S,S)-butanediol dehydrogenase/diacetyl reductase